MAAAEKIEQIRRILRVLGECPKKDKASIRSLNLYLMLGIDDLYQHLPEMLKAERERQRNLPSHELVSVELVVMADQLIEMARNKKERAAAEEYRGMLAARC